MAIYFMGGEDIDFLPNGTVSVSTDSSTYRAEYARCSLAVSGGAALGNSWRGLFESAASAFWFGCRVAPGTAARTANPGQPLIVFNDGISKRLGLSYDDAGAYSVGTWDDSGTYVKLISSVGSQPSAIHKLDMRVSYGTSGAVRVFVNGVEIITYTGDITRSGSTTLSSFALASSCGAGGTSYFSEITCTDRDSRTLMLKTHVPSAAGSTSQWTGSFADIDETTINEADGVSTNVTDQVSSFDVTNLPTGSNLAVRGFKVSGYAARGETGPQNLALGVVTNASNAYSDDIPVDTGWTRLGKSWENNPVTGTAWTSDEINALQISVKSRN